MSKHFKTIIFTAISLFALILCSTSSTFAQSSMDNQLLDLFHESDLENKVLVVNSIAKNKISYTTQHGWQSGRDDRLKRGGDIVCQGSGISFAECVRTYVAKHGTCMIYKYKNGDLYMGLSYESK